jgi:hypothetical protein
VQGHFTWNATEAFNYTLTFSNSTASAPFYLSTTKGAVTIEFSGHRVDYYSDDTYYVYDNPGNFTIALNTSDPRKPAFQWLNGAEISRVTASKSSTISTPTQVSRPSQAFDGRVTLGLKAWDRTAYWVGGVLVVVYAM